jgi:hypothetical protein
MAPHISNFNSIEAVSKHFADFSTEIKFCFANSEWEKLTAVLADRQRFFEQILLDPKSEQYDDALIQLVQSVLAEDSACLSKVHEHKRGLMEMHCLMEQGRQAVKAYETDF